VIPSLAAAPLGGHREAQLIGSAVSSWQILLGMSTQELPEKIRLFL
jgi:hypothetical protein